VSFPGGVRGDRPKVFHYFQHSEWPLLTLQVLLLLIVGYHAAIGGQDPVAPLCTPSAVSANCSVSAGAS